MERQVLIEGEGLTHGFDRILFSNVSVAVEAGQSVAVMGRSGSGKSTLLHILAGLLPPQGGSVRLLGEAIYALPKKRREAIRRYETGVVFQSHYLFKGLSARENVQIAAILADREISETLYERLEIADVIDHRVSELSGGQQQRVSLARVLAKEPRILFADEPTGNLDIATAEAVLDTLLDYVRTRRGALFLVTHDPAVALRCDRILRLENGTLEAVEKSAIISQKNAKGAPCA